MSYRWETYATTTTQRGTFNFIATFPLKPILSKPQPLSLVGCHS